MKNFFINLTLIFFISSCASFLITEDLSPPPTDYWKQVYQELNTSDAGISNIMIQIALDQTAKIVTLLL